MREGLSSPHDATPVAHPLAGIRGVHSNSASLAKVAGGEHLISDGAVSLFPGILGHPLGGWICVCKVGSVCCHCPSSRLQRKLACSEQKNNTDVLRREGEKDRDRGMEGRGSSETEGEGERGRPAGAGGVLVVCKASFHSQSSVLPLDSVRVLPVILFCAPLAFHSYYLQVD